MSDPVRVRFAPSPTGLLHVGGVRTALFNYLFAKRHGGDFILRLEDTDRERFVPESVAHIEQGLEWVGLVPDEGYWLGEHKGPVGPYVQSQRLPHYQDYARQLVDKGHAYYSRIEPAEFERHKQAAIAAKRPFVYRAEFEPPDNGKTGGYPIRLRVPAGTINWHDELRGDFGSDNALIDDFIIVKADGYPTYNFANVIDDHLMRISHVIRGDEFISSTPKHALLYDFFGWPRPQFIHLPVILGSGGRKKLSKRDGDVDILSYRDQGFLPAAMVNFLALLGWNDGTEQELFSLPELVKRFDAARIQTSPAVFDAERLRWMNGEYIRQLTPEQLATELTPYIPPEWARDSDYLIRAAALDQERLKTLAEARAAMEFFFAEPAVDAQLLSAKAEPAAVKAQLAAAHDILQTADYSHDRLESSLRQLADSMAVPAGQLFYAIRVAVTGRTAAPGLFETLAVLGRDRTVRRLEKAIQSLP